MRYALIVIALVALLPACGRGGLTEPTGPPFALAGGVFDTVGRPLGQARVEVLTGPHTGVVAVTDNAGFFVFGPIFDSPFTLRASKEGRRDQSRQILNAQSDSLFRLQLDLRGHYEITFTADAACAGLPAAARSRTYSASFDPIQDSSYLGTLSGADFAQSSSPSYPDWNVLYVTASEDAVDVHFSDPEIWEHLTREPDRTPQEDLVIIGEAIGTLRPDTSHGSFAGRFMYCAAAEPDDYPECKVPEISCVSQSHQWSLTRK